MSKSIKVYTDASYRQCGEGSYGYIILLDDRIFSIISMSTKNIKINCLELLAIKYSLNTLLNKFTNIFDDKSVIEVYTDSMNCVHYLDGSKNVHLEQLKKTRDETLSIIDTLKRSHNVKVKVNHVKGHSNSDLNNIIDNVCTLLTAYNIKDNIG